VRIYLLSKGPMNTADLIRLRTVAPRIVYRHLNPKQLRKTTVCYPTTMTEMVVLFPYDTSPGEGVRIILFDREGNECIEVGLESAASERNPSETLHQAIYRAPSITSNMTLVRMSDCAPYTILNVAPFDLHPRM
jgi:hypothetical protein